MSADSTSTDYLRARVATLEAEVETLRGSVLGRGVEEPVEARFRATFERAAVGVAYVGLDGRFLTVNHRLCEMLGYTAEELLQRTFQDITHPDDLEPDLQLLTQLIDGEIERFEMEKRYIRPSGEIVWTDLSVSLERDGQGAPRNLISVVTDIGPRKQTEERLNFLLNELNHRSKNLLAVVQAAVRQIASDAVTVPEFKRAVDDRIRSIAASQDVLVRHDHSAAPVEELVRSQLASFIRPDDHRVTVEGPFLELSASTVHSLGLAVYELATNACKYGALSRPGGRVRVEWSLVGDRSGRFMMLWTERGGPPVSTPERSGFGRRVVERMIAASVGGQVDLRFDPEGLSWRLDAPAASVVN